MSITLVYLCQITIIFSLLFAAAAWFDSWSLPQRFQPLRATVRLRACAPLTADLAVFLGLTAICYTMLYWNTYCTWFGHRPVGGWASISPVITFSNFFDLNVYAARFQFLRTPRFWDPSNAVLPWEYPPAMTLLYAATLVGGGQEYRLLLAFCALVFVPGLVLARQLAAEGLSVTVAYAVILASMVFSYPVWMEAAVGNTELYLAVLVGAAVLCFWRGRAYSAAALFGVAAALKIFPFVFFGLFLCRRQYRQIIVGAIALLLSSAAGLWLMAPGLLHSLREIKAGLAVNRSHFILLRDGAITGIDHSGFGLVKQVVFHLRGMSDLAVVPGLLSLYLVVVAAVGVTIYFWRIVRMPLANQVAALVVASILLPPTSHDYTLLHLYTPWTILVVLAVRNARLGRATPGLTAAMVCFGALFAPELLVYRSEPYGGQLKCLLLIALGYLTLRYPWTFSPEPARPAYAETAADSREEEHRIPALRMAEN